MRDRAAPGSSPSSGGPAPALSATEPEVRGTPVERLSAGRGRFISFEGIEGSGKTSQIGRLAERLQRAGAQVVVTREPGGTELGRELRRLLLRTEERRMSRLCELLIYVADRAQHLAEVVEPALELGSFVLCDRYVDATLAYQGYGRRIDLERILAIHRHAELDRLPDRTILLDLDPARALRRARQRNVDERSTTEGRFEKERLGFHRRVREGYLSLASISPQRIRVIDASGDAEQVERRVLEVLLDLLPTVPEAPC